MQGALRPLITTILFVTNVAISAPMDAQTEGVPAMQLVTELPGEATTILAAGDGVMYLVVGGSLVVLRDGVIEELVKGDVHGAAIGVDGSIYYTERARVLRASTTGEWQPADVSDDFGGSGGARRVMRTPDGRLWVEGASQSLGPDGTGAAVPGYSGSNVAPIPLTRDLYANYWTLAGTGSQTELLVLAANAPDAWQVVPLPDGKPRDWNQVLADDNGMVWIGGRGGLRQLNPHAPDAGWQAIPGEPGLRLAESTALALSPDGAAMAGLASGQVFEVDLSTEGAISLRVLSGDMVVDGPVQAMVSDGEGNAWVVAGRKLYRIAAGGRAWQKQWQALGRLPGGNHDIFAAVLDGMLYTSGGATSGWGYPARPHLFDELWVYDPGIDVWRVVGHMPFHRCYNGVAALDGEIWNVGGAIHEEDNVGARGRRLPLHDVDIYNPSTDSWRSGPPLLVARQEPVVVTANGRTYAIGGSDDSDALDSVESIGSGESVWRREPTMPQPMRQYAGCVLDGIIYVASQTGALSFDPQAAEWSQLPPPPQLLQASQIAAHDGQVWMLGSHLTDRGYRYSPADRQWQHAPRLPTPNSWGAAAELGGRLVVAGGAHKARFHFVFDDRMYALRADWDGGKK